jgi:hypothetical protein
MLSYNRGMRSCVIYVSNAEAASTFQRLLDQARDGAEVIIEHDGCPFTVLRASEGSKLMAEMFAAISRDVPEEDWAGIPSDLSKQLDHYLYGTGKISG